MNTNFIAVTSRPRKDNAVIVDLVSGRLAPSSALVGSVQKNKTSDYITELSGRYRADDNKKFVLACSQVHSHIQGHKTVYLITHKSCEKWMMEGFKSFYKTVGEASAIVNGSGVVSNM